MRFWLLGIGLIVIACESAPPKRAAAPIPSQPSATPSATPSAPPIVDAGSEAAAPKPTAIARGDFERVMTGAKKQFARVTLHVLDNALVVANASAIYAAEKDKKLVKDEAPKPMPQTPVVGDHPDVIAGHWPDAVVAVHGHFPGSGNDGVHHAYTRDESGWKKIDNNKVGWDTPDSLVRYRDGFLMNVPVAFNWINGLQFAVACDKKTMGPLEADAIALPNHTAPKVPRIGIDFFLAGLISDGDGKPLVWGYRGCEDGIFAARIDGDTIKPARIPGTEVCKKKNPNNSIPHVSARMFPRNGGGAWAILSEEQKSPCLPPTLMRFDGTAWTKERTIALPPDGTKIAGAVVDPDGVVYVMNRKSLLVLDPAKDIEEIKLPDACSNVAQIVVPWSGDPFLLVAGAKEGEPSAVCRRSFATAP